MPEIESTLPPPVAPAPRPFSRQRAWALRKRAVGLCVICGQPAVNAQHCEAHRVDMNFLNRLTQRKRYRLAHGIPLDVPDARRGERRKKKL